MIPSSKWAFLRGPWLAGDLPARVTRSEIGFFLGQIPVSITGSYEELPPRSCDYILVFGTLTGVYKTIGKIGSMPPLHTPLKNPNNSVLLPSQQS